MTQIKIQEALGMMMYALSNNVYDYLAVTEERTHHLDDTQFVLHTVKSCCEALAHMIAGATGAKQKWSSGALFMFDNIIDEQLTDEIGAYQIVYPDGKILEV